MELIDADVRRNACNEASRSGGSSITITVEAMRVQIQSSVAALVVEVRVVQYSVNAAVSPMRY